MRLILVRHGQTEWNQLGRIQGRTDIPLNDTGIMQARAAGEWLSQRRIDAVYSSPMQRAFDTATEIARPHGLPVISLDDIIEKLFHSNLSFFAGDGFFREFLLFSEES